MEGNSSTSNSCFKFSSDGSLSPVSNSPTLGSYILGPGKPFKTRSGDTVKLNDLLDEAEERALKAVRARARI